MSLAIYCTSYCQIDSLFDSEFLDLGDCKIISSTLDESGDFVIQGFEVEIQKAGMYYLAAWVNGSLDPSGEKLQYSVLVNDDKEEYKIRARESHPHAIDFGDKLFFLSSGNNKITFQTKKPNCPNVEFIKLSLDEQNHQISSEMYDKYFDEISKQKLPDNYAEIKEIAIAEESSNKSLKSGPPDPECNYDYEMDVDFGYTYYLNIWLSTGTVTFETKVATSDPVMYLFFFGQPTLYTWSDDDGGESPYNSKIVANITESGLYTVLIRRKSTSVAGICSLYKNSTLINSNCAVSGSPIQCAKTVTSSLNWFTADLTGDSHIWLEDQTGTPGKIIEYNDDSTLPSDFSWGKNSRIRKYVSTNVRALIVSSHSSWNPTGNCDVYMNCMNSTKAAEFLHLKSTDAIQSAPNDADYNCIGWSGGRTDREEWPPDGGSPWEAENERGKPEHDLCSFDNFYANRTWDGLPALRYYPGPVMNFIRMPGYGSDACVALWGFDIQTLTHASVKKPANDQPHGYDWESKDGLFERFFHPKDALRGDLYGDELFYYRWDGTYSGGRIYEKSAAALETGNLVSEKNNLMKEMIQAYSDKSKFEELYEAWKYTWDDPELNHHSNPRMYAKSEQYSIVLDYCQKNGKKVWPLVFNKYVEGEELNAILIADLTFKEYLWLMDDIKHQQNLEASRNHTAPSTRANYINYITALLGGLKSMEVTDVLEIDEKESFKVYPNPAENIVNIEIIGLHQTKVVISICDLTGKKLISVSEKVSGNFTYSINIEDIPNGTYLCKIESGKAVNTIKFNVLK
jgi:hypothetical protein